MLLISTTVAAEDLFSMDDAVHNLFTCDGHTRLAFCYEPILTLQICTLHLVINKRSMKFSYI
jgi:hypothetical protein